MQGVVLTEVIGAWNHLSDGAESDDWCFQKPSQDAGQASGERKGEAGRSWRDPRFGHLSWSEQKSRRDVSSRAACALTSSPWQRPCRNLGDALGSADQLGLCGVAEWMEEDPRGCLQALEAASCQVAALAPPLPDPIGLQAASWQFYCCLVGLEFLQKFPG